MANFIYLPINSEEMQEMALDLREKINVPMNNIVANKVVAGVGKAMYRWIDRCLKQVGEQDTLYVLAHGAGVADSDLIGGLRSVGKNKQKRLPNTICPAFEGGAQKTYTPDHLASTLKKEGLSRTVTTIKVLACGSGLSGKKEAWAKRLQTALLGHCNNLTTVGYMGLIRVPPRQTTMEISVELANGGAFVPLQQGESVFAPA